MKLEEKYAVDIEEDDDELLSPNDEKCYIVGFFEKEEELEFVSDCIGADICIIILTGMRVYVGQNGMSMVEEMYRDD